MVRAALLADQRRIGRTPHHGDSIAATQRRETDLTLQQLADRRGLASSTLTTIEAGSIEAFPSLVRHSGEAFLHVMSGQVTLHTEHDAPTVLAPGDSFYFDSSMARACVSSGEERRRSSGSVRAWWRRSPARRPTA